MADEKIVFEVDVTSLAKALGDSQTQLEIYKRDMEAAIEANGKFSEQANIAAGLVAAQTKAVQQQTGAITRLTQAELALGGSINEIVKSYDAENKSVDQNRKTLNALTTEYIKADKVGREKLAPTIKKISDELKKQEGAIGNTTRNVGNYGKGFDEVTGQLTSLFPALQLVKTGQVGVNAAMAANPAGALIAAFQILIGVFSSFKPIVEAVEKATAGLSAGFGALINGGNILEAAEQAAILKGELNDLEDAQNGVTIANAELDASISLLTIKLRAKGITEKEAEKISAEIQKLSEQRFEKNSAQQAAELKNAEDTFKFKNNLTQQELDALVERGQTIDILSEEESARLKRLAKDAGLTEKEIQESAKSNQLFLAEQAEAKIKGDQKEAEAEIKIIAERRAAILGLGAQRDELQQKVDNQNERISERFKAQRKASKEETAAIKEKYKVEGDVLLKAIEDYKKFNLERDEADKKGLEGNNKKRVDDFQKEQEFNANKLQLDLDAVDLSVATEQEKADKKYAIQLDFLETQLKLTSEFLGADGLITKEEQQGIDAIANSIAKLKQKFANDSKNPEETFGSALGLDKETVKEISGGLQVAGQVIDGISSIASAATQVRLNEIDAETNAEIEKVNQSTLSEEEKVKKISAINAKANKEKYEAEKAAFETNKALQIVNAIIGTAVGVINAFQLGPIAGAIMAAVIAATGVAQIAVIASQAPPPPPNKFATGVIGLDGEGTETSDSIDARLSKGESVLTAKATRKYHRQLAYMEMSVGNKPNYQFGGGMFAGGFIPSVSGDGGFLARETIKQSDSALMMSEAIRNGFALAPAPVLSIVELNTKQRDINRSVNLSEA
jgi:hypothetical protein